MIYNITPVPKPRQTKRDQWAKRPAVLRYRAFADECKLKLVKVPDSSANVVFYMPMPKSWSKKKKLEMVGKAHQQKPDVDNLLKALLDAVYHDDCSVWNIEVSKKWSNLGAIEVTEKV